jgi:hypothetical protein
MQIHLKSGPRLGSGVQFYSGLTRGEKTPLNVVVKDFPGGKIVALRKRERRTDEGRQQQFQEHERPVSHLKRQWRNARAKLPPGMG